VTILHSSWTDEVRRGLEAGNRVVSAGQNKLRNGQSVVIDNSIELDS